MRFFENIKAFTHGAHGAHGAHIISLLAGAALLVSGITGINAGAAEIVKAENAAADTVITEASTQTAAAGAAAGTAAGTADEVTQSDEAGLLGADLLSDSESKEAESSTEEAETTPKETESVPEYKTWKQIGDNSWANISIGSTTIRKSGCAVVSLAMLCVHSGSVSVDGFDPGVFANGMKKLGAFSQDGSIKWQKVSEYTSNLQFTLNKSISYSSEKAAIDGIKDYLNSGNYVIIRVNNNGSTHFVCLDYVTDDKIFIMDPGKRGDNSNDLFASYGYGNITGIRLFKSSVGDPKTLITEGKAPQDPIVGDGAAASDKAVASSAGVVLDGTGNILSCESTGYLAGEYTTISALNLRQEASIESPVLMTLTKKTKVKVTATNLEGWGKITINKTTGWICLRYVK